MLRPDLVVFDCDGVLVDSEVLAARVESKLFAERGFDLAPEEISRRYSGMSYASMRHAIEAETGREIPEDFEGRVRDQLHALFESDLCAVPGVVDAVRGLSEPACVASSSDLSRVEHTLSLTGFGDAFAGRIFSAQMVERGKPAPDLFLLAASRLGARPERCIVVEDSRYGIQAARAAGMRAVGFVGGGHCGPDRAAELTAAGAHVVLSHMSELIDAVTLPG